MAKLTNNRFRPTISSYSISTNDQVRSIEVQHGTPLLLLDYSKEILLFQITMIVSSLEKMAFVDFYNGKINSGVDSFLMDLDLGYGLEEVTVQMIPDTLRYDGSRDPIWTIIFTVRMVDE
jgi:hypothetical protein